ncbi:MAG TPA: hypothetical protein VNH18_02850 [Bryobacteraceae bacterium]|nr:hypothetical protein [Bryobacteraceae bacterium]
MRNVNLTGRRAIQFLLLCAIATASHAQSPPRQDPTALAIAKTIYRDSLTALRDARTLDDMKKVSQNLDSPDWISVDRFGRTILTRKDAEKELESMLSLPPERRVGPMEIIWADRDSDHLTVLAWMFPSEGQQIDREGEYGPKGARHHLTRGTLIRDVFVNSDAGWRRIRHDKLLPNSTVLAVDGTSRIVPPLDEQNRVTLAK